MQIKELFIKPIDRPINGVIYADQKDSTWQELEEYVVTQEHITYFRKFFDAYLAAKDNPDNSTITGRMGVWVSGFFGSGKSHYIKILSYLLENIDAVNPETGEHKNAIAFFDERKIKDPMLLADIQRAIQGTADVMLFNIDAKADGNSERDAILQVFLRVFNNKLGFFGDAPYIAHMERHLVSQNAYEQFKAAFKLKNGNDWTAERDAVDFLRDEIVAALVQSLGMKEESAGQWFDNAKNSYKINIEKFAILVSDYLKTKPESHRVIFLVDEVGQFIGNNTQLMLTLQTIVEQLGTHCKGRAWVIVTSQEDIDAAIGESNKSKSQEFSRIQARFYIRQSLSSSKVNEVIGERLLSKIEQARIELSDIFNNKGDIINNQLSFSSNGVNLPNYENAAEFVAYYPFVPYQFTLLQKIFESIRKVGAAGKHLSEGERSLLDAFKTAAEESVDKSTNALIPLYDFYPSIESFIDSAAKRSIDQAPNNNALEPYDTKLLKALFLIRYISETIKPNIDNLATLCVDEIDADKLVLKQRIQESLVRLEKQQLVNRNGDLWFFLTNEERDIAREIGHETVSQSDRNKLLAELIFDEIFKNQTKVRHKDTKSDYDFNRYLDGMPFKNVSDNALTLEIITPLGDDYANMAEATCILRSSEVKGRAIIRMAECNRLYEEMTLYLQIEKYVGSPKADQAIPSLKRILADRKDENRERKMRLAHQLEQAMLTGEFYALGQKPEITSLSNASVLFDNLGNYLITNTYSKLTLLKHRCSDANAEIKAVLTSDDVAQRSMDMNSPELNPLALNEVRQYLALSASQARVLLSDVVIRYTNYPYGWKPESEIVLLVARLFMAGEIKLMLDGGDIEPRAAIEPLTKSVNFKRVAILKRKTADSNSLTQARTLHKELFLKLPKDDEDGLTTDYRESLHNWSNELNIYNEKASRPNYPAKPLIEKVISQIGKQLAIRDSVEFIQALLTNKNDWLDLADNFHDISSFYKSQAATWQKMLDALKKFEDNREALQQNNQAVTALKELHTIRDNPEPYGLVSRIDGLLATVEKINEELAAQEREIARTTIDQKLAEIEEQLSTVKADADLRNKALHPMQQLKINVATQNSIPQIHYLANNAGTALDNATDLIIETMRKLAEAQTKATSDTVTPVQVATQKAPQKIVARNYATKAYLETEDDVDVYLAKLRQELLAVLKNGKKARIE